MKTRIIEYLIKIKNKLANSLIAAGTKLYLVGGNPQPKLRRNPELPKSDKIVKGYESERRTT